MIRREVLYDALAGLLVLAIVGALWWTVLVMLKG